MAKTVRLRGFQMLAKGLLTNSGSRSAYSTQSYRALTRASIDLLPMLEPSVRRKTSTFATALSLPPQVAGRGAIGQNYAAIEGSVRLLTSHAWQRERKKAILGLVRYTVSLLGKANSSTMTRASIPTDCVICNTRKSDPPRAIRTNRRYQIQCHLRRRKLPLPLLQLP